MTDLEKIASAKEARAFPRYIDYIRFPLFRNLLPNSRIDFGFPITAFVGQNGCGKSSALQALFGAPEGRSVGTYWFNTELDPIHKLNPGDRHCFIYACDGNGNEILKTRINKRGKLDLWDTSPPIHKYGMAMGNRTPPIAKEVIYVNFRAIPNAFEKAFHSERPPRTGIQKFLRRRAKYLRRVLAGEKKLPYFKENSFETPIKLSPELLQDASLILGRSYESATMIRHRLFDDWGTSIVLKTQNSQYSDAFAGSGESAVIILLYEISKAAPNSLLLLDEPETSLHPGAQKKLMDFLTKLCLIKKVQLIFCTHSPTLIASFPPSAIKVFTPAPCGKFQILQNISPEEAFHYIGQPVSNKTRIHVEDKLTKLVVDRIIDESFPAWKDLLEVVFHPGGVSAMHREAVFYSRKTDSREFMLFDGDQRFMMEPHDPDRFTAAEMSDLPNFVATLKQVIEKAVNIKVKELGFAIDGDGLNGNLEQMRDQMVAYIKYLRSNYAFMPAVTTEDFLWDDTTAGVIHQAITGRKWQELGDYAWIAARKKKDLFAELCEKLCKLSQAATIEVVHQMFITHWIHSKATEVGTIKKLIQAIKIDGESSAGS